ncbi:uncharacterized protein [Chelonus insularis]|uniref:uncharacterized protein n=1 Tax=Chelonus insularis TaxID=460826 RepID=UPI00158EC62A|nr:uncharacterized protein LOC118069898 [Chelonus insularis]
MNAQHYQEWIADVLRVLPKKSVIVLDQAPYHTMLDPEFRNPTTQWRKLQIIEWLIKCEVEVPSHVKHFEDLNRNELLNLARPHHYSRHYVLNKVARKMRNDEVKILWLPVAYYEYNPIELVWAYVKNYVAKRNKTSKVHDVHQLCIEAMDSGPPTLWPRCIEHAKKEEDKSRELAKTISDRIESIVETENTDSDVNDTSEESENDDEEQGKDCVKKMTE